MKRKKKVLLILVSIILFCIWYWWMYVLFWSNALDRISVAADLAKGGYYKPFQKVEELEWIGTDDDYMAYDFFGCDSVDYEEEYIKDNYNIGIFYENTSDNIVIEGSCNVKNQPDNNMWIILHMIYNPKEKKLVLEPIAVSVKDKGENVATHYYDKENIDQYMKQCNISEEDIREYQNYILYDVVVKTWTKAHGGLNFLERLKIGLCIEDHTFDFEYQE